MLERPRTKNKFTVNEYTLLTSKNSCSFRSWKTMSLLKTWPKFSTLVFLSTTIVPISLLYKSKVAWSCSECGNVFCSSSLRGASKIMSGKTFFILKKVEFRKTLEVWEDSHLLGQHVFCRQLLCHFLCVACGNRSKWANFTFISKLSSMWRSHIWEFCKNWIFNFIFNTYIFQLA